MSGFEEQIEKPQDLFILKDIESNFINQELKKDKDTIKCMAFSESCIILVSQNNRIFRWLFANDKKEFVEHFLPEDCNFIFSNLKEHIITGMFKKTKEFIVEKVFLDAKGFHCIFSNNIGQNYYFNCNENKIRYLKSMSGNDYVIKSIAFDDQNEIDRTHYFLIGTDQGNNGSIGNIYRCQIELGQKGEFYEDKPEHFVQVALPIIHLHKINLMQKSGRQIIVLASTSSSIYCFYGSTEINSVFEKYMVNKEKVKESCVDMSRSHTSLVDICYSKKDSRPLSMIWTNGKMFTIFKFPEKNDVVNDNFIKNLVFLRYGKKKESELKNTYHVVDMPIGLGVTEYHYYILHSDILTIMSRITEKAVHFFELKDMGQIQGMIQDKSNLCFWIFSNKQFKKLEYENEDMDIWTMYMAKKQYEKAYEICKKYDFPNSNYIGQIYGDSLFNEGKFIDAAQQYFKVNASFEEIFMKFITKTKKSDYVDQNQDGLECYLQLWLDLTCKKIQFENKLEFKAHKTLIIGWIIEIKLYRLNKLDKLIQGIYKYQIKQVYKELKDENESKEVNQRLVDQNKRLDDQNKSLLEEKNLNEFLKKYIDDVDDNQNLIQLINQLMQSHGRLKNIVELAKRKNYFETVIMHHINDENYSEAINQMSLIKDDKKFNELIIRYSPTFMQHKPKETCQLLKEKIGKDFHFNRLISGLMNIPKSQRDEGITFLKYCIKDLHCKEKSIHNILIFFLSDTPRPDKLLDHLEDQERKMNDRKTVNFDLDFAVRLFEHNKQYQAQIKIYGIMKLYEEAVSLALQHGQIQMAKDNAKKSDNQDIQKKLWLKIAVYLLSIKGANIEEVINLTKEAGLIKIEDLLPHFNENIKIEHFKDQICESLQTYNNEITHLKEQMDQYSKNAESLKNELKMIKNRYMEIDANKQCDECSQSMFIQEFYVFPCKHGFHKDCIIKRLKSISSNKDKCIRIRQIEQDIHSYIQKSKISQNQGSESNVSESFFFNLFGGGNQNKNSNFQKVQKGLSEQEEEKVKKLKEELDKYLASECINCGTSIVESIFLEYESDNDPSDSWKL